MRGRLTEIVGTQKVLLITWIVIVTMLVLATLRLPVIFTALFTLVDVALLLNLLAVIQFPPSATLVKAAFRDQQQARRVLGFPDGYLAVYMIGLPRQPPAPPTGPSAL